MASTIRARTSGETRNAIDEQERPARLKSTSSSDSGVENSKICPFWYRRLNPRLRSSKSRSLSCSADRAASVSASLRSGRVPGFPFLRLIR